MRIISTKAHGILDYLMGIFLIATPWIFGFANNTAAQWIPVTLGIVMIVMAFFTNYEMGVIKIISMRTHLTMDIILGLFLAVSPWLFNFDEIVYSPHLILGLLEVGLAMMTSRIPHTETNIHPGATNNTQPKGYV
jgi:hypothetical protein